MPRKKIATLAEDAIVDDDGASESVAEAQTEQALSDTGTVNGKALSSGSEDGLSDDVDALRTPEVASLSILDETDTLEKLRRTKVSFRNAIQYLMYLKGGKFAKFHQVAPPKSLIPIHVASLVGYIAEQKKELRKHEEIKQWVDEMNRRMNGIASIPGELQLNEMEAMEDLD